MWYVYSIKPNTSYIIDVSPIKDTNITFNSESNEQIGRRSYIYFIKNTHITSTIPVSLNMFIKMLYLTVNEIPNKIINMNPKLID